MSEEFDPYRKWLGIPPKDQPPNHYRLLGIAHFEDDPDVIENAATRQMAHVRTFQSGRHGAHSQRILNELTAAKLCLLLPEKKTAYDAQLHAKLAAAGQLSSEAALDAGVEEIEASVPPPPPTDFRGENRWRTGADANAPPPAGVRPVPIPMPGTSPLLVKTAAPRRTGSVTRPRKSNSALPVFLIVGSLVLLAMVGIAVVMMTSQPTTTANGSKGKSTSSDKKKQPGDNKPAGHTQFPIGSNESRPKHPPFQPRPEPVATRPRGTNKSTQPEVAADAQAELVHARQALALRDENKYQFHIGQANYLNTNQPGANAEQIKTDEEHLKAVHEELKKFWRAVHDGAEKKIPKGERFKFRKKELELVLLEKDQITYKVDGAEATTPLRKLPAPIAIAIAYRSLGNDDVEGKIAMALFLAVDAEAASDPGSHRLAAKLNEDLVKAGVEANPLLEKELIKLPMPTTAGDDDFTPPLVTSPAPMPLPSESNSTSNSPKPAGLNPEVQKEARKGFDKLYRERLLQAEEQPATLKPLMEEMVEAAKTAETNELKVLLLSQACELAAKLGDSSSIVAWGQQIGELSGENPLDIQLRLFGRCKVDSPEVARELVKNCFSAIDKARSQQNLFLAIEFWKAGSRAGEKYPQVVELPKLLQLLQELEKEKAERK